jgi:hypothetical protein
LEVAVASDASPLTLSYPLFERLWKALVSKRKARKLNVDRDTVWQQLGQSGENAEFLRDDAASKELKRDKGREPGVAVVQGNALPTAPNAGAAPKRKTAVSKTASVTKGKKSASSKRGTKRGVKKRTGAAGATGRRKRVAGK